jgi:hypothetical protein
MPPPRPHRPPGAPEAAALLASHPDAVVADALRAGSGTLGVLRDEAGG